jgi:adenylate cyclase
LKAQRVVRRLAAVLAADVVGYSRLMGENEEGTLRRVQAHRRELVDPKVREHRGRIVKTTGDGMLVEFGSVVDAVRCAVEVQRGMIKTEEGLPADREMRFRIGVNLGDIIIDGDDIFGDGVNVAARLEALAEPGGVCISGTVRDHIGERLPYAFADCGEQSVKNIASPVHVFAINRAAIAATPFVPPKPPPRFAPRDIGVAAAAALVMLVAAGGVGWRTWLAVPAVPPPSGEAKPAPRLSLMVLPFANLSNDPEQEYFADAIADDLTTDLSRTVNSFVIARTTAFTYKGKAIDVKQIGHDLGVRYVIEGSVHHLGEPVQVNVQLIDAETGAHIWAERFDTDRTNLAKAQNEIVATLARKLQLQLLQTVARRIEHDKPENVDARDLIMRGWALYHRPRLAADPAATLNEAEQTFEKALAIDPQSLDARVGIAWTLGELLANGLSKSREQDMQRAEALLREVFDQDRNDPRAATEMGRLRRLQGRLAESRIELERAVGLDPSNPYAIAQLGITTLFLGQPDAALAYLEKWLRLDPHRPNLFFIHYWLGHDHLLLAQADEAVESLMRALSANPCFPSHSHLLLAAALGLKADTERANVAIAEWVKCSPKAGSIAAVRLWEGAFPWAKQPEYVALREKTEYAGLRGGMPEQ